MWRQVSGRSYLNLTEFNGCFYSWWCLSYVILHHFKVLFYTGINFSGAGLWISPGDVSRFFSSVRNACSSAWMWQWHLAPHVRWAIYLALSACGCTLSSSSSSVLFFWQCLLSHLSYRWGVIRPTCRHHHPQSVGSEHSVSGGSNFLQSPQEQTKSSERHNSFHKW